MNARPTATPAAAPIGLAPGAPEEAAGQDAKKYASTNPVVSRLLERWTGLLRDTIGEIADDDVVVDVGVGEGLCLERFLPSDHAALGVEYRHDKALVDKSRIGGLAPLVADAGMVPVASASADLVTCIEVLEHLITDDPAVAELARICRGRCVVSVPWEPWFRLGNLGRGKNISRFGNDPEHVQFFTPSRLHALLSQSFAEVRVVKAFPWLIAEARGTRV
jgi:2-polyprenyl-3-methyl-5-hydroxy-6-metoxy-1,4-benzoquinol methylase